jgi:hypothetical protein
MEDDEIDEPPSRTQGKKRQHEPVFLPENETERPPRNKKQKKRNTSSFDEIFQALVAYKKNCGNCNVPQFYSNDTRLGEWVSDIIRDGRTSLSKDKRDRLDKIGFNWEPRWYAVDCKWNKNFEKLKMYKQDHGNCCVPQGWTEDPPLAEWVRYQRRTKDVMDAKRKQKLNDIGFLWEPGKGYRRSGTGRTSLSQNNRDRDRVDNIVVNREAPRDLKWNESFAKLKIYQQQYGNCRVPRGGWKEDRRLGEWVSTQRQRKDRMDPSRKQKLDKIGFVWSMYNKEDIICVARREGKSLAKIKQDLLRDRKWNENFLKLKIYKQEHGNFNVPRGWKEDPPLFDWVRNQRRTKDVMDAKRKKRLDDIAFVSANGK